MKKLESNLEKLSAGCFLRGIQKENSEPGYTALGQVSKETRFLGRQWEYVGEIERVLKELHLTKSLIGACKTESMLAEVSGQELLAYYQGIFFTLVHQMKDKVLQLIHLMTEKTLPKKLLIENDVSVSNLLKKKQKILQEIGIEGEIKEWKQDDPTNKIAVVLRKRTQYHHRVSGLRHNEDFSKLGLADTLLKSGTQEILTEQGKEKFEKMRADSADRLFSQALEKAEDTLKVVEENIEKISGALVNHFNLPISEKETLDILNTRNTMSNSFSIRNTSSFEKIPTYHKELLKTFTAKINAKYQKIIETIYLVGSLGRGEYEEGYSDVNIYIIFSEENMPEETSGEIINDIPYEDELDVRVLTKKDFLSDKYQKYRIISKADGLLLYGTDLVVKEKLPNAGLFTALILNEDILDDLDGAKKWAEENSSASLLEMSKKIRKLSKRIIDFLYGVTISNKPQYTSSRAERVLKIDEAFPENKLLTEMLVSISKSGAGNLEEIKDVVDTFRPRAEKNLNQMLAVKEEDEAQREKSAKPTRS